MTRETTSGPRGPVLLVDAALAATATLIAVAFYAASLPSPVTYPDSGGYVRFDPVRTATYPLFIRLVGEGGLLAAQWALYAVASAILIVAVRRTYGSLALALALLALLSVNLLFLDLQRGVLTEGLFIPVSMLFLAGLVRLSARPTVAIALAASALAGLAATIRPAALPLIVLVPILLLLRRDGWRTRRIAGLSLACALVWGGVVGAERLYSVQRHGAALTSLAGPHLYAKAALIEGAMVDRARLQRHELLLTQRLEKDYAPVRAFLRSVAGTDAFPIVALHYEVCIQHTCTNLLRAPAGVPDPEFNAAMLRVGAARIRSNLAGFIGQAWRTYALSWAIMGRPHPAKAAAFDALVQRSRPLPFEEHLDELTEPTRPADLAVVARPVSIILGVLLGTATVTLTALALAGRVRSPVAAGALLCGLYVQIMLLFNAFTGVGVNRYTLSLWPGIALGLLLTAASIAGRIGRGSGGAGSPRAVRPSRPAAP